METSRITLNYVCDTDGETATQPLTDIVSVGTLICTECGDDMSLTDTVEVAA